MREEFKSFRREHARDQESVVLLHRVELLLNRDFASAANLIRHLGTLATEVNSHHGDLVLSFLRQAVAIVDTGEVWYLLSVTLERLGAFTASREAARAALDRDPNHSQAWLQWVACAPPDDAATVDPSDEDDANFETGRSSLDGSTESGGWRAFDPEMLTDLDNPEWLSAWISGRSRFSWETKWSGKRRPDRATTWGETTSE